MRTRFCVAFGIFVFSSVWAYANEFSWQKTYAKMSPTGDIEWSPQPFKFEKGNSIRYIDYEGGNDLYNGLTQETPWKHHPWDPKAIGKAKQCKGIHTYVFKRGVYYRGALNAHESGKKDNPIRLTSDPAWGTGQAVISGGHRITGGWKKGAENKDIPEPKKVWMIDLDFAPRTVYLVEPSGKSASQNDKITRIPLARMPNWKVSDPEDVKSEWWRWDNPGHPYFHLTMKAEKSGRTLAMGKDTKHLTRPKELYMGAILWAEFGWVDGTPYPSYVQGFDAEQKALGFEGYLGSAKSRVISRNHRYYLEDKPHYLDDPDGEYWFEKKGTGGRLHIILPNGQNPNSAIIEAGKDTTLIDLTGQEHIVVSGLTFRFTNVAWDLTEIPWQYSQKFRLKKHIYPACIRVWGPANDITIANCIFEHINNGVLMKAVNPGDRIDHIVVRDCEFRETDHNGMTIEEGLLWGDTLPDRAGHLYDVKILRNYLYRTGLRSPRIGAANAINVDNAQTLEVAGNVVERAWHAGINVRGSKISGNVRDCPLTRILIYQNKVTDSIRTGDDCGNIETWQGGSAYVFNNISGNPGGFRYDHWMSDKSKKTPGGARFGMAYYLDGAFKNYYFNNIGWGLSNNIRSPHGATTMFQEIISYQNMFFNNTAYNFLKGTRRQAPQAGRNKFLGNIWDSISDWVFWHTPPAKTPQDGNERDAGKIEKNYALETNAFARNVFHNITAKYGSFKSSGKWHPSFEECKQVLKDVQSIAYDLGIVSDKPVMNDPANKDFSLTADSPAIDRGVKCFVPWSLYATVGEWHFYPAGHDPSRIMDEHWYMAPYYYTRDDYHKQPMFPLTGVNITKDNYVDGPLEDWTKGTCTFNGKNQYAVCPNDRLNKTLTIPIRFRWDKAGQKEDRIVTGKDFKSPQIWDSNFCVEAYFKTESTNCVLVQKMAQSGYGLTIDESGKLLFTIKASSDSSELKSLKIINDDKWHHVIAEADRSAKKLTLYIDGRRDSSGSGIGNVSINNESDLFVCGTPNGRYFKGTIEFLRISLGTLKDAQTDIRELYAWQFDGPSLRDFAGRKPKGKRDAGALESVDVYTDPKTSVEDRVQDLLGRLTLEEKARFMAGKDMWFMKGVERLGIPSVQVTDCGHGVTVILDEAGRYTGCATCFPTAVAQAASWDKHFVYEIGRAIARETRDLGSAILLAPMVNIHRTPLNGRNYETYSEDPFLAGMLASSFIKGVQSEHIGAVIKAMTANNQQTNQQQLNVEVSERALREIYLPAFRIPVLDAKPWGVMTAYNSLNGYPTCASKHLISTILKKEWGYDGFVVSDWRSVKSSASIPAGLDIEMPGPGRFMATKNILNALAQGNLTEDELNDRVSRYLRALVKSKLLDFDHPKLAAESNTQKHRELARKAAEGSIILLRNSSGILPLNKSKLRKLAVIGPNAEEARLGGGGSASVTACHTVSPLEGLKNYCGQTISIEFAEGATMKGNFPVVGNPYLITKIQGKAVNGLKGEYFDNGNLTGQPSCVRIDDTVDFSWGWAAPCKNVGKGRYSVRWTGSLRAPFTGTYRIGVTCHEGGFRLYINDRIAIDQWENRSDETFEAVFSRKSENVTINMEKEETCDIRLEFRKWGNKNAIRLEWDVPGRQNPIEEAVRLAAESDAAIVFAGLSNLFEGGMNDRESLALPEGQEDLIRAVAKANANTIVVLINGTPVAMPWLDDVPAVIEAYYPGQEGGHAIARILFGDVNPSGKLPETFPKRLEDNPSHGFFPGEKQHVSYGEGIYVGYRHYDTKDIEPLYPFGHGLSYTKFEYRHLQIRTEREDGIHVTLDVKNVGKTTGAEVVQLYVRDIVASIDRPVKELKAFAKIELSPGQTKQVELFLERDAFAFFSPTLKRWIVEPGEFELLIGSSSRDIRLTDIITVE